MVVPKEGKEKFRIVQNFRKLNFVTIKDPYPLHLIERLLGLL